MGSPGGPWPRLPALLGIAFSLLAGCSEPLRGDHLVLISIDTLRADHLGTYGYARDTSPTLDALAAESLVFERAYSHSSKTAPSHMTLFTGLHPAAHGVMNLEEDDNASLADGIPTLASLLRDAGYRTGAVTGGGHLVPALGFDRGFDEFHVAGATNAPGDAFARALRFVGRDPDEPLFLFLHSYEVHDPYTPPAAYRDLWADPAYAGRILGDQAELVALAGDDWSGQHREFWRRVDRGSDADIRQLRDLYDASIRFLDAELAGFLGELERRLEPERTAIVVLSDHGEEFAEHGGLLHETVYQELLRVPLVLRIPAASPWAGLRGVRSRTPARLVDLLPTLLDLLGIEAPEGVQGRSLLPIAAADPGIGWDVLSEWPRRGLRSLRLGDWKLIVSDRDARSELYALDRDPGEQRDLAAEELDRVAELRSALEARLRDARRIRSRHAPARARELDEATRASLRALGYLESEDPEPGEAPGEPGP